MKIKAIKLVSEPGWLTARFGPNVAQISTNTMLRLRSSIADVTRARLGFVPDEISRLCKSIPNTPQGIEDIDFLNGYESDDGKEVRGLLSQHKELQEFTKTNQEDWANVLKLLGIVRQKNRHASAWIIADKPIHDFIPLMTVGGERVTQYTAASCEASGAVKMDYLCLNTLIDMSNCIKLIQERSGFKFDKSLTLNGKRVSPNRQILHKDKFYDIYDLPEDQEVFRSICEGDTDTVFQLNTESAKQWLKEFDYWKDDKGERKSIDSIDAISAFTALDRPGPLDAITQEGDIKRNMLQEYAARARGEKPIGQIEFLTKELVETHGVMVYQEALQYIYQKLTECSGIDANKFREDISKKRMAKVLERYGYFIEKATTKIGEEQAQKAWEQIFTFGQYGFCAAHATSYAVMAYACAYLKYHFPLEWWCAVLQNADKNEIGIKFWKHCKHLVLMPDITHSKDNFYIKGDKIVAPLGLLLGVGENAQIELSENRPYSDINDFCIKISQKKANSSTVNPETGKERVGNSALNRGVVSKLIVSGVADSLFPEGTDVVSKLEAFEQALATALNKRKPEKIKEEYRNLSPLQIYQHKKSILPIYSENLAPYLYELKTPGISLKTVKVNGEPIERYVYKSQDLKTIQYLMDSMGEKEPRGATAFVDGKFLRYLNEEIQVDKDAPIHTVVACYIMQTRSFSYLDKKSNKQVSALELILDVDGETFKVVKWPLKKTGTYMVPEGELEGSICLAFLSRWNQKYGFSVDAIIRVVDPLEKGKKNGKQ